MRNQSTRNQIVFALLLFVLPPFAYAEGPVDESRSNYDTTTEAPIGASMQEDETMINPDDSACLAQLKTLAAQYRGQSVSWSQHFKKNSRHPVGSIPVAGQAAALGLGLISTPITAAFNAMANASQNSRLGALVRIAQQTPSPADVEVLQKMMEHQMTYGSESERVFYFEYTLRGSAQTIADAVKKFPPTALDPKQVSDAFVELVKNNSACAMRTSGYGDGTPAYSYESLMSSMTDNMNKFFYSR